jgi:hypothetical protein
MISNQNMLEKWLKVPPKPQTSHSEHESKATVWILIPLFDDSLQVDLAYLREICPKDTEIGELRSICEKNEYELPL